MIKWVIAALALLGLLIALMPRDAAPQVVAGEQGSIFGGAASTWAQMSADGHVTRVGLDISMELIENAPMNGAQGERFELALNFPDAVRQKTFFDHVYLDFNPAGHPPAIYQVAHFDIHFYGVTNAERLAVDCTDLRMPSEDLVPQNYVVFPPGPEPDGGCVPQMGIHAVDITSPELHPEAPQPFNKTMVLGYYGGSLTFFEPMITREHLLRGEDFTMAVKLPKAVDRHTLYPTGFYADYDPVARVYHLIWWGFQSR